MVELPLAQLASSASYRLVSSKFPPITLFEDIADPNEFEALYQLQALTNPRVLTEVGDLGMVNRADIPFGIPGCSYAVAPFTHVNPDGSRFSDGSFGVLYLADSLETAITEVRYHQQEYLQKVEGLHFDRLVFRALKCSFAATLRDATTLPKDHLIYAPNDYSHSRVLGGNLRYHGENGLVYWSVRNPGAHCWGLFTPKVVTRMSQSAHYEFIWDGQAISSVSRLSVRGL